MVKEYLRRGNHLNQYKRACGMWLTMLPGRRLPVRKIIVLRFRSVAGTAESQLGWK